MTRSEEFAADSVAWELEIERFAGGEMNRGQENALLARCEIEPDRWRDVALACAEQRRLAAALKPRPTGSAGAGSARVPASGTSRPEHVRECVSPPTTGRDGLVPALAAALAITVCGTGLGYRLGLDRGRTTGMGETATQSAGETEPAVAAEQLAGFTSPLLPEAARAVLRDAGIDVREEPVVYLVAGRDGERWAVPERQLHVRLIDDATPRP